MLLDLLLVVAILARGRKTVGQISKDSLASLARQTTGHNESAILWYTSY